jgi:hypothetical protein
MKHMPYEGRSSIILAHLSPNPTLPLLVNSPFLFLATSPCSHRPLRALAYRATPLLPPVCRVRYVVASATPVAFLVISLSLILSSHLSQADKHPIC